MDDIMISASDVQVLLECWSPSPHASATHALDPSVKLEPTPVASPVSSTLPVRQSAQLDVCHTIPARDEVPAAVACFPAASALRSTANCRTASSEQRDSFREIGEQVPDTQGTLTRQVESTEGHISLHGPRPSPRLLAVPDTDAGGMNQSPAPIKRQQNLLALHWPNSRDPHHSTHALPAAGVTSLQQGWPKVALSPRSHDPPVEANGDTVMLLPKDQHSQQLDALHGHSESLLSDGTLPVSVERVTTSRPATPADADEVAAQPALVSPARHLPSAQVQCSPKPPAIMPDSSRDASAGLQLAPHFTVHEPVDTCILHLEPDVAGERHNAQTTATERGNLPDDVRPMQCLLPAIPLEQVAATLSTASLSGCAPVEQPLIADPCPAAALQGATAAGPKILSGRIRRRSTATFGRASPVHSTICEATAVAKPETKKGRRISGSATFQVHRASAVGSAPVWQWPENSKDKPVKESLPEQPVPVSSAAEHLPRQKNYTDDASRKGKGTLSKADAALPISGKKRGRPALTYSSTDSPETLAGVESTPGTARALVSASPALSPATPGPCAATSKRPPIVKVGFHPLWAAVGCHEKLPAGALAKASIQGLQPCGWFHGAAVPHEHLEMRMLMTGMHLPALLLPDTAEAGRVTVNGMLLHPRLQAVTQADAAHKAAREGDHALLPACSSSRASIELQWPREKCVPALQLLELPSMSELEDLEIGRLKVHRLRSRPTPDATLLSAQQARLSCGCGTMQPASTPTVAYVQAVSVSGRDRLPPLTLVLPSEYKQPAVQPRDIQISVSAQGIAQVSRAPACLPADDAEYARQLEKAIETTSRSMRSVSLAQKNKLLAAEQPFEICLSPDATLVSVMHASLVTTEVIGLLAGRFSAETNKLIIRYAIPCRALPIDEDKHVNVELDPAHSASAHEFVHSAGLTVVGWYHSHPSFQADPSIRDIENQLLSQQAYCKPDSPNVPYVAMIISPNDPKSVGPWPNISFFQVRLPAETTLEADIPMSLKATQDSVCIVSHEPVSQVTTTDRTPKARPSRSKRPERGIEDATSVGFLSTSAESMLDDEGKASYLKEIEKLQPSQMRGFAYELVVEPTPTERLLGQLTAQLQEGLSVKSSRVRATLLELSEFYAAEGKPFDAGLIAARAAGIDGRLDIPALKRSLPANLPFPMPSAARIITSLEMPPAAASDSSFDFEDPPCANVLAGFIDRYSHAYELIFSQNMHCSFALAAVCDLFEYYRRFRFRVSLDASCDYLMITTNNELVTVTSPFLLRMEERVLWVGSLFGFSKQDLAAFASAILSHLRRCWT
jgi:proteasome lid subunit RPN8/RPN11